MGAKKISMPVGDYVGHNEPIILFQSIGNSRARRPCRLSGQTVRHFAHANKPIAAISHGAQLLAAAGVVKRSRCTANTAIGSDIKSVGGEWVDVANDKASVDGNLELFQPGPPIPRGWRNSRRFLRRGLNHRTRDHGSDYFGILVPASRDYVGISGDFQQVRAEPNHFFPSIPHDISGVRGLREPSCLMDYRFDNLYLPV